MPRVIDPASYYDGGGSAPPFFMRVRQTFVVLLGLLVLSSVPIAVSLVMRYGRALFSLDVVAIVLMVAWKRRAMAALLILGFVITESIFGFSQAYPLFNLRNVVQAIRFIPFANPFYIVTGFAVFTVFVFIAALGAYIISRGTSKHSIAVVLLALSAAANISILTNFDPAQIGRIYVLNQPIFGSTIYELYYRWRADGSGWGTANDGENFYPLKTTSATATVWPAEPQAPKVLLVVVESWGAPSSAREYEEQVKSLATHPRLRVLDQGNVDYSGGTVAGELRELCQIVPISYAFAKVPQKFSDHCLPQLLGTKGYRTIALHAAHSGMYARDEWYPTIGFQQSYFLNKPLVHVGRCHGFPGYCDVELIPAIADTLIHNDKVFFYWMTLNSHVPYEPGDLKERHVGKCVQLGLADGERCNQFLLIKELFDSIAKKLGIEQLSGLEILMVGDHKPAFFRANYDDDFVKDRVPYLHLQVK